MIPTHTSPPVTTDTELLRRVGAGDAAAFEELHERFSSFVKSVVIRIIGGGPDVGDVCQNAFMAVWKQAFRFDPARSSPPTWIALLTRSVAVDALRVKFRGPRRVDLDTWAAEATTRPINPTENEDMVRLAREILNGLPDRQQLVLGLACFRGLNCREIAHLEDLPVGTVKTLYRRGARRLRTAMEPEFERRFSRQPNIAPTRPVPSAGAATTQRSRELANQKGAA